jgi:hypothetical protein
MTFDLSSLALEEQASFQLNHPGTGLPLFADAEETLPVEIVLKGKASPSYQRAVNAMMKRDAQRGGKKPSPEQARQENVEFLTTISVEITNMDFAGKKVDTPDAFRTVYSDDRFVWIREQIGELIGSGFGAFLK